MFEVAILLSLLGLILWFILTKGQTNSVRRASFIDLSAELKPPTIKSGKERRS